MYVTFAIDTFFNKQTRQACKPVPFLLPSSCFFSKYEGGVAMSQWPSTYHCVMTGLCLQESSSPDGGGATGPRVQDEEDGTGNGASV